MPEKNEKAGVDIYGILLETSKKKKREKRTALLETIKAKDFFEEGEISVDMKTCRGIDCRICIKMCPTNALYWKSSGEIGITEELCLYCASCVLNCMVNDCIKVKRTRFDGEIEQFSKPSDVVRLIQVINMRKRLKIVNSRFYEKEKK